MKIKKVVLMANNPDAVGGITTFLNTIAPGFREAGYDVEFLTVSQMHENTSYLLDESFSHHIGVAAALPAKRDRTFARVRDYAKFKIYRNRRLYKKLRHKLHTNLSRIYKSYGRDTVIIITQVYGAEQLRASGINLSATNGPYVVGMYHDSFEEAAGTHNLTRLKECFKDVDKFLCLTQYDAEQFRAKEFTNTGYIYNPVSIEPKKRLSKNNKVAVSLGRYHPQKSLHYLVRAWSMLAKKYPDWRLDMYGGGPEQAKLQKLIDDLDIGKNTTLKGKTSAVGDVLADASINVLSSQHEGLPIAIVEAARFQVPTVSFDSAPGIAELIDDGVTGIITPRNNTRALAEGIERLIQDDDLRRSMGLMAQKESMKYQTPRIIAQWERLFDTLTL